MGSDKLQRYLGRDRMFPVGQMPGRPRMPMQPLPSVGPMAERDPVGAGAFAKPGQQIPINVLNDPRVNPRGPLGLPTVSQAPIRNPLMSSFLEAGTDPLNGWGFLNAGFTPPNFQYPQRPTAPLLPQQSMPPQNIKKLVSQQPGQNKIYNTPSSDINKGFTQPINPYITNRGRR